MRTNHAALMPIVVALVLALLPAPAGLAQHAWYFAAIFIGVVVGLILEPAPPAAVGLIGVTIVAVLSNWVLFSPAQLGSPGFDIPGRSIEWALSGFSNSTVWLSFAAFMFSTGYQKTGLGRRIALSSGQGSGGEDPDAGLCGHACRHDPRALHSVQHRTQRRQHLSDHSQLAATLSTRTPMSRLRAGSAAISCGRPSPPPR